MREHATGARGGHRRHHRATLEIIVASKHGLEPIGKFPPGLNVSYYHHMSPASAPPRWWLRLRNSTTLDSSLPGKYAGPSETREAGVFTRYINERYDSLPDVAVFVHADIDVHNPVWLRWLYCLRRNVEFASLSPAIISLPSRGPQLLNVMSKGSAAITDGQMQARLGDYGFPNCCFLVVVSRSAIHRHPRTVYEEAERALATGKLSAYHFELQYDMLFQPVRHAWRNARDVCATFQCEHPACATNFIRHVTADGPLAVGHSKKHTPVALLDWENECCGVQDLTQPEWRTVGPTARERLQLPCVRMARDDKALCVEAWSERHLERERQRYSQVLPGYSAYIRRECSHGDPRCSENATYASHNVSAKTVCRSASCITLRCWLECCAACASRSWCVAWEWHMETGSCDLSAQPPGRARAPSHKRVVGVPMPPLEHKLREFRIADTDFALPLPRPSNSPRHQTAEFGEFARIGRPQQSTVEQLARTVQAVPVADRLADARARRGTGRGRDWARASRA